MDTIIEDFQLSKLEALRELAEASEVVSFEDVLEIIERDFEKLYVEKTPAEAAQEWMDSRQTPITKEYMVYGEKTGGLFDETITAQSENHARDSLNSDKYVLSWSFKLDEDGHVLIK